MMKITLNGETRQIPNDYTAAQLVELLDMTGERMAMEVNQEIVPRSTYEQHVLCHGDKIEIVGAIGGG
jgi:sulfur carrier protein